MNKDDVLRIATECFVDRRNNVTPTKTFMGNDDELSNFAARLEAELMKGSEPVAWINDKLPHMTVRIKPYEGGNWVPVFPHPAPIPSTHVLVPKEPTEAMIKASWDLASVAFVDGQEKLISVAYKAMIAAAQGEV